MSGMISDPKIGPSYSLAKLYHLNTVNVPSLRPASNLSNDELAYGVWGFGVKDYPTAPKIHLPNTDVKTTMSISEVIGLRQSVRQWNPKPMSLEKLGTLLRLGGGIVRTEKLENRTSYFRAAPSGGGRYPIEIYPIVFRVQGLKPGVYHYNCFDHTLNALQQDENMEAYFCEQCTVFPAFIQGASIVIAMTAVMERTMSKYSDRGYRYILLEAGHITQNISLMSIGLGLGSFSLAGYYEHEIEKILWVDGLSETLVYTVVVGHPKH
ncbi:MAG: SagB/ThcOx family dehydrogenase [Ardenticatenaceae bacterium]